jgi:hypothetical protein
MRRLEIGPRAGVCFNANLYPDNKRRRLCLSRKIVLSSHREDYNAVSHIKILFRID